ncbi:MAG: HAMP domain-containing sensor histidine kinase [Eubacteriales bacterium]|nr:HAMP domain-containing sensor histidine kinase [Eubacteriales bacterium]
MKKFSVKIRLTVWLTLLTVLLAAVLFAFMLIVSSTVYSHSAMSQLSQTVKNNVTQISMEQDQLRFGDEFHFYQNGVSTLIYSRNEALLAGQIPVSFTAEEAFQNGLTRTVSSGDQSWLVLDLWLPMGWENGVWVRGLMEAPDHRLIARNLLPVFLIALPVFALLAALGSYRIVKRAFVPLDTISTTAAAINEARDLSRRIVLPPGRDEFSRLADTFNQLFERLERSFEAEKQFTADASHELRTPVSVIKGACEYAQKYDETLEERQETLSMIYRQAVRMSDLISQLLSITRLDQGTELTSPETVNLGELLRFLCEQQHYDQRRLTLEVPETLTVWADPALLTRLAQNLIDNAFKYGRPDGHVWVSACRSETEVLLQVRDNGIGIAPDQQKKIWQRFYQVDPSRSRENGAGLGLSMVEQIARVHGGYMTLDSVPDRGSTFTLHLPVQNMV